jgi:hypothetical protein
MFVESAEEDSFALSFFVTIQVVLTLEKHKKLSKKGTDGSAGKSARSSE